MPGTDRIQSSHVQTYNRIEHILVGLQCFPAQCINMGRVDELSNVRSQAQGQGGAVGQARYKTRQLFLAGLLLGDASFLVFQPLG